MSTRLLRRSSTTIAIGALALLACGGSTAPAGSATAAQATPAAPSASPSSDPGEVAGASRPEPVSSSVAPSASTSSAPSGAVADATSPSSGDLIGTVTLPGGKPGKNGVVWLEDGPKEAGKIDKAWIDNAKMAFAPFIAVVTTGAKVTFHNSDPFPHNVFSPDHEKFDLGSVPKDAARTHVFESAGSYTLLCNLHPGMIGYVLVIPSTVYAHTDAQGNFRIKGAPGGAFHVNAWAPRMKGTAQAVTISGSETKVEFTLVRE